MLSWPGSHDWWCGGGTQRPWGSLGHCLCVCGWVEGVCMCEWVEGVEGVCVNSVGVSVFMLHVSLCYMYLMNAKWAYTI